MRAWRPAPALKGARSARLLCGIPAFAGMTKNVFERLCKWLRSSPTGSQAENTASAPGYPQSAPPKRLPGTTFGPGDHLWRE
ncbi:MAG: hypothetical protein OXU61_03590 [Gammaproteobacteria bacterium]|nr:hypothetical protein [Gammaproteobacteria bacterium]